ncbi:MAG: Wzz/FepE/Etk N-terminal domain-containing protein [Patescibacteria group bacterium]
MNETSYITTMRKGWKRIALFAVVSALFAAGVSFAFPLKYSSSMRLLIIQQQLSSSDPYTAIKASERIADNLAQILYTTSFYDKVMAAKFNVDEGVFGTDEIKKRKRWQDTIATQVVRGSGMLDVTVYHVDPDQAEQISQAIAFVLTTEGSIYVGGGDLEVRLVDDPLVSRWPVRPNIPANALAGLVLGGIAGAGYVIMVAERRRVPLIG